MIIDRIHKIQDHVKRTTKQRRTSERSPDRFDTAEIEHIAINAVKKYAYQQAFDDKDEVNIRQLKMGFQEQIDEMKRMIVENTRDVLE